MALQNLLGDLATEATTEELLGLLDLIADRVGVLTAVRQQDGSLRVSIASGTLTTISTVTTVGTVTNMANIAAVGGYSAQQAIPAAQNLTAVMSNVNNVIVS